MSKIRGAINAVAYNNVVNNYSQAIQTFGSDAAIRDEYTRFRDMWNKRLDNAIASGRDLTGTAMDRFLTRNADGSYSKNLPTLKELGGDMGAVAAQLGKMQRTSARQTSTIRGANKQTRDRRDAFKDLLKTSGFDVNSLSNDQLDTIGDAFTLAHAMGDDVISYEKIRYKGADVPVEESEEEKKEKARKYIAGILKKEAKDKKLTKNPVVKGAVTRLSNSLRAKEDDKKFASAVKRLNNALRKYGGQ